MNADTAETMALDTGEMIAVPSAGAAVARPGDFGWLDRLRADAARMEAVRDCWRAFWSSRLLVWVAGVGAVLLLGFGPVKTAFNPVGVTGGFGWFGDVLAAPAARWDSAWYVVIAHHGYRPELGLATSARAAFFPLYPMVVGVIGELGSPLVIAGLLVSVVSFALALYGLHRLTTLELGDGHRWAHADTARLTVMVTAFAPMAFFFSSVYSEALYLALSVAVFWCAREGRWGTACALGAFAAATRSAGVVLMLPIAILYLYGPRNDRLPDFPSARGLRPRYRLRLDALWLGLVPVGLALFMAYLSASGGDALAPFHAQQVWDRHFAGPFLGIWDGAVAAFDGARQLASLQAHHNYFHATGGSPMINAEHNLMLFLFLVAAVPAVIGVLRALPLAYGAYVLAALALPLSYPVTPQPLMSLPRFLVVLFPLNMWLGAWLAGRPRARRPVLGISALLMVVFVAQFATWHWVA